MTYPDILDRSMIDRHHSALDVVWGDRCNSANREVPVSGEPGPMPEPSLNLGPSGRPIGNVDVSQPKPPRSLGIGRVPEHDNAATRRNRKVDCGHGDWRLCGHNKRGKQRVQCRSCGARRLKEAVIS